MRVAFAAILLAASLSGCFKDAGRPPPSAGELDGDLDRAAFALEQVVDGLQSPVFVTSAQDGTGRLFVLEQEGRIRIVDDGGLAAEPFLDIRNLIENGGERGLLGLAFDPDYGSNGRFYVDYTNNDGNTVVARYTASYNEDRADAASGTKLLGVDQPFSNHNGGMLAFGPDGYLYVALGDGGSAGDPLNHAQDKDDLLGKILRLDVSGTVAKAPSDNPFVGRDGHNYVWAYGLRNPWRFSFDRATGDMYVGDVGQNKREEIDYQPSGSDGGENYGWRVWEGSDRFFAGSAENAVFPVAEYNTGDGGHCAVTGGYVYRGSDVPSLRGVYLYADYCSGEIWGLTASDGEWESRLLLDTDLMIPSFGEDEAGELYVVHHGGSVDRIVAAP